jgi:outer membrane lipoprotein-sorting protein
MSNRKFAEIRTTTLTGKPVIYFAASLATSLGAFAPNSAHAQSASDVYKKMSDVYAYAKSFQGTIVRTESGKGPDGKPATQVVTVKISFKAPNKYNINNTKSVTVSGKTQSSGQSMVTDGKALYMFAPERKLYQRGQIPNENMLAKFFAVLNPANGFTMLPDSKVNGRAAFVLKPNVPTKGNPAEIANAKKVTVNVLVDKQTYEFLKMTISGANGSLTQTVNGQVLNGAVPDSVFVWSPPAGYKEVKPQAAPSGGPVIPGRAPGQ